MVFAVRLQAIKSELGCGNAIGRLNFHENSVTARLQIWRKPATYERILRNIEGCRVNIHGTITQPMLERPGYLGEYIAFWSERSEVVRIWMSLYTPQRGEQSTEMLTPAQRDIAVGDLLRAAPDIQNC